MHRVLEHIDRHLDQALELQELADVAHFSAFHFHRVFAAWMGETLGDYLRRRRVEIAATRLIAQPRLSVLDVALSVGFGSSEAFARAFKIRFGCTPTAWREKRPKSASLISRPAILVRSAAPASSKMAPPTANGRRVTMNVKIIERQPVKVAYLRHIGPYGKPISDFWQQVVYPWIAANGRLGQPRYGISHDDPTVTAGAQCRYDACVEPSGKLIAPGESLATTIPGGHYAVSQFRGTVNEIEAAWNSLLRDWLPMSGMQLDARPFLEYYPQDSRYDAATGIFTCQIMVPVVPIRWPDSDLSAATEGMAHTLSRR